MTTFDLTSLISLDNIEKNENKEITIKKFNLNYSDTCTDVLYIMKYNKEYINLSNIKTLGCLRSIITNKTDILCFSPQKSINFEDFDYSDKENILYKLKNGIRSFIIVLVKIGRYPQKEILVLNVNFMKIKNVHFVLFF